MTAAPVLADASLSCSVVDPRWATPRTPERPSFGPAIGAIAVLLGRPFMPWQQLVVDVATEVQSEAAGDPNPGDWAYDDVTVTVQRQAGKTTLLRPVMAHRAGSGRDRALWMTAQKREKARDRFLQAAKDIHRANLPFRTKLLTSRMGEALEFVETGSMIRPFAPNEDDLHGEDPDFVAVDELWAFARELAKMVIAGYQPGFTTKDAQAWKLSTAGTDDSWWLNTSRKNGRAAVQAGRRLGIAYFEWSLPDRIDGKLLEDLTDIELIEACILHHPANGYTLRPASLYSAFEAMDYDRAEFLRAYGNRTANDSAEHWRAIAEDVWTRQVDLVGIPKSRRVAFGVWVDDDGKDAAIAASWRDSGGRMHVEHLRHGDGYRWIIAHAEAVAGRQDPLSVAVANVGTARDVADELEAAGVPVLRVAQADVKAACSRHVSELEAGSWWHALNTEVTESAKAADLVRGAWARTAGSVSLVGAQTLAGWAFDHAPEDDEPKRFRIG
jgi:hypothetical protein